MTLSHGRHYLAIPGPSVIPDSVLSAMHRPAPNIYEGELISLTGRILSDLKRVAGTTGDVAIYIANGHGAWEAAAANVIAPGDEVLVLATGPFALGWAEIVRRLGGRPRIVDFGRQGPIDAERVKDILARDRDRAIRAVMMVHVDTATSIRSEPARVRAAIDAARHPALLLVDGIASVGIEALHMDAEGIDVLVGASQKGLMTPPGLGLVWFGERAEEKRSNGPAPSAYWDWRPRTRPEAYYQHFCGTAPTHHLFALAEALRLLLEEQGLEAAWARHAALARAVWAAVDCWDEAGAIAFNVPDAAARAHGVTALRMAPPFATRLREWLADNVGVTLGIGLGMAAPDDPAWHGFFRIGHMGHVNAHMVLGVLGAIEAALAALGIDRGEGAVAAAAKVIAEAVEAAPTS